MQVTYLHILYNSFKLGYSIVPYHARQKLLKSLFLPVPTIISFHILHTEINRMKF